MPPLPPSSSVPPIYGILHLPPFLSSSSPSPLCLLVPPQDPTSSFLPLPLLPVVLFTHLSRSDSPLGVLAHLGGGLSTCPGRSSSGQSCLPESPSPPESGRTCPKAASVPTAEPGLRAGQRPLEVRLGIAALVGFSSLLAHAVTPDIVTVTLVCVGCA